MKKGSIFMVVAIIAISIFSGCNSSVNSIDNYEGDLYLMDLAEKLVKDQNDTEFKKVSDELSELSTNEKITVLRFGRQISPINDSPENEKYLQEMEVIASEYFDKLLAPTALFTISHVSVACILFYINFENTFVNSTK